MSIERCSFCSIRLKNNSRDVKYHFLLRCLIYNLMKLNGKSVSEIRRYCDSDTAPKTVTASMFFTVTADITAVGRQEQQVLKNHRVSPDTGRILERHFCLMAGGGPDSLPIVMSKNTHWRQLSRNHSSPITFPSFRVRERSFRRH